MNDATPAGLSTASDAAGSRHVVVVYTDAGGGHRATAEALRDILCATGGYRVTLVNAYQEVLSDLDLFARFTSRTVEATYNDLILRRGRTGLFCLGFYAGAVLNVPRYARAAPVMSLACSSASPRFSPACASIGLPG